MKKSLKILAIIFLLIVVSFINIDKEKIRYIQKGKGLDILLIHGTPGCLEDWYLITNYLSKNYRVTAFDRLGNSFTSSSNYNYTLKENVALIHKLIDSHLETRKTERNDGAEN